MASIVWARPARDHVRAIVDYVAKDSAVAAARLYARILDAPKRLELFPGSGSIVPEFGDADIREVYCGAYRVVYWIQGDECRIVAVVHGSRDFLGGVDKADWELD